MSGRKETYVSITARERDRLYQEAARASSLASANRALADLARANDEALEESRQRYDMVADRIRALDAAVTATGTAARKETAALRAQLQEEIRSANQRLQEATARSRAQMEAMGQSFDRAIRETRQDMADAMAANNRRIEAAIDASATAIRDEMTGMEDSLRAEMSAVEGRLDGVQATVQGLSGSNDTLLDMAREYAEMTGLLTADAARYRCEVLLPGGMKEVENAVAQARSQMDLCTKAPTNAPVARDYARQAFERALDFHQRLLRAEQAWQMDLRLTRQSVDTARAQLEASRVLALPECEVDVDRWTCGDLERLSGLLTGLEDTLKQPDDLSAADLADIRAAAVQASREADEAAGFALVAVTSSQDRADTAADLARQLWETFSLRVESRGYQGDDPRGAHRIHLKNPGTCFEMVITQTPRPDGEGRVGNRLESDILCYGPYEHNAAEADALACRVLSTLGGDGLEQSEVTTVPGYERRESDRTQLTERETWDREAPVLPKPVRRKEGETAVR